MKVMLEQTGAVGQALSASANFDAVLAQIFEGAAGRDADPAFPQHPFKALSEAGLLALSVTDPPASRGRRVSGSCLPDARHLDGCPRGRR